MEALDRGHGRRCTLSRLAPWSGNFSSDNVQRRVDAGGQVLQSLFGGLAKYSGPLSNHLFREYLGVIGTCHTRIEMDFPIAGEHTSAG
jgi:hypothetical protein